MASIQPLLKKLFLAVNYSTSWTLAQKHTRSEGPFSSSSLQYIHIDNSAVS